MTKDIIKVWYDGACSPINPGGHAGCGIVVKLNDDIICQDTKYIGYGKAMSNNVAEYAAVIQALNFLLSKNLQHYKIIFHGDSMLTVGQMSGLWKSKTGLYVPYYIEAKRLAANFTDISFKHIPREKNTEADILSKKAIETYCKHVDKPNLHHRATTAQVNMAMFDIGYGVVNWQHN